MASHSSSSRSVATNPRIPMSLRLFVCSFPTGISYADRSRERDGDYVRVAFLPYGTLVLEVERDCPADLRERIERDARRMEMLRGHDWPVSSCGQTVRLGGAVR